MNSKMPRITVITPSFNQARFLERTICSVLDQGYENLEYMVIDGGSTDGSVEIIERYAGELAYWQSGRDGGQADAINQGLKRATGDVVGFINSDDLYLPGALETVGKMMGEGGEEWVIGRCNKIDPVDGEMGWYEHRMPESLSEYLMGRSGFLPQPSSFWSAGLFKRLGGFDTGLDYVFDYEFNCRLLAEGVRPRLIGEELAAFRLHGESKTCSKAGKFVEEHIGVGYRYLDYLPWRERWRTWRILGYRQRLQAIAAAEREGKSMWGQLARHPWWIASPTVRAALRSEQAMTEAA